MRNLILSSIVVASIFVGCQSSGGLCCDGDGVELQEQEWYLTPVAVMDYNDTTNILSCSNSYDRDQNNQSIQRCDWNITNSFSSIQFSSMDDINMSTIDLEHSTTETFLQNPRGTRTILTSRE